MMHNTASVAAGAPTYARWWSSPGPVLLPCMLPLWTSARPLTRSTTRPCGKCWKHELISLIKDLYEGNRVRVAGQGVQSEWFCIRTGVRQGCPLSPLLFNIFMDFLARQVIETFGGSGTLAIGPSLGVAVSGKTFWPWMGDGGLFLGPWV